MRAIATLLSAAACCMVTLAGCGSSEQSITLATTTSTQDSGLLDVLVPRFEKESGIKVKVVAVGSGQALQLGQRGDADVLLVHDAAGEEKFVAEGYGVGRRGVMYNDFVLVGPPADPAGVKGTASAAAALGKIAEKTAAFVSRGDESGTHQKERQLWAALKAEPKGDWYIRAGAGMGQVLRMASEKRAYTLTDRGTYLAQRAKLDLAVVSEGDPLLRNPYSVIVVKGPRHEGARKFADFLRSPEIKQSIGEFGKDKYGQSLFFPEP